MERNEKSQAEADWPVLPSDFVMTSFSQATAIKPSDVKENVYLADIKRDWCIGIVPHGGYLMSTVVSAVQTHFQLRHSALKQIDLITFHVEFLARSSVGPAEIAIHELKLGRQFSTVRVQLLQYPPSDDAAPPRICLEAHITMGNLQQEMHSDGLSLPTRPALAGRPLPPRTTFVDRLTLPKFPQMRPAAFKIRVLVAEGQNGPHPILEPSVHEQWVQWAAGVGDVTGGFQLDALPYLADAFRPLPEAYGVNGFWYPTLSYGMEVKKAPPSEKGWEWLFLRIEMRLVSHGRFDLDVIFLDDLGDLVAVSTHTALIVSSARNHKPLGTKL